MKKVLTYCEMQDLLNCSLYHFNGYVATPNTQYMKPDAPVYLWMQTPKASWFELAPDGEPVTDYSGCHRDA